MSAFNFNDKEYIISQVNGQRITSLKNWASQSKDDFVEIYIGKLPRHYFEDTLMPVLSIYGEVLQLRLMMCYSGFNRGFCYVFYKEQDKLEIILNQLRIHTKFYVSQSRNIRNLAIRFISKYLSNVKIVQLILVETAPVKIQFIIEEEHKNVVVQYGTHRETALAKRSLISNVYAFGPDAVVLWHGI